MMPPLREIDLMGMLVAPFALCLPIALVGTLGTLAAFRRTPGMTFTSHSPLLGLALFVGLLSCLVLLLGQL